MLRFRMSWYKKGDLNGVERAREENNLIEGQREEDQQAMTTMKGLNKNHQARMVQGEKQRAKKTQVTEQPSQAA